MSLVIPFIPTPEELAERERLRARHPFPAGSATPLPTADAGSHTHSTAAAQALPGQPPARPPLGPCILTAEQLAALVIPPRPALLDRWLCQGDLGYIFAPRGVGKTWMAMALPGAISCRRALGLWQAGTDTDSAPTFSPSSSSSYSSSSSPSDAPPTDSDTDPAPDYVPVLYIDGEMSLKHTQYRAHGLDLSHVHHLHHEHLFNEQDDTVNIGDLADRERINTVLQERGYQVLILDNLSSLASGMDENKGMDYEPVSHWLLQLRRRKITVIVIHHAGRSGAMRGHTKREDACSWILELRDARQEGDPGAKFVSHFAKPSRNTGDPLPDLLWHFTTDKGTGITDIHCELAQVSEYEQFIQHVIEGVTSQKDIAEMMDKNKGTVSKWARKALQDGRLSGGAHKLLPPKETSSGRRAKMRVHASDDDFDDFDDGEDDES